MHLLDEGHEIPGALYGKIVGTVPGSSTGFSLRFTSMSLEIERFLQAQGATIEKVTPSAAVAS